MAGAGFKTFNTGDVLTASDVNTYLMQQTVMVFDDAAARTTALTGVVAEGMMSYLKDTNKTYRYDGSAWLDDAGTTSPLTTKGDVWGYSTTDARIPVGADGTVLTADSNETLGVKWAAAGGTPTFVGCSLYKSASQSISNTTSTVVTWDSEVFDTDAFHDTSTNNNRITIPSGKGGYYQFIWIIQFPNNANGQRSASLRKNGTFISFTNLAATNNASIKLYGSFIIDAVATDYFDVTVFQDAGTSQIVEGLAQYSNFQAIYLGA